MFYKYNHTMSTIKNLLVSGCSFTAGFRTWANALAKYLDVPMTNLARPGAGNRHIARSLILYLERNNIAIEDTLIVVMWTNPDRVDWLIGNGTKDHNYRSHHHYDYDSDNHLALPGLILKNSSNTSLQSSVFNRHLPEMLELAYHPGTMPRATMSWESINHLNLYLCARNCNFYQTTYFDPNGDIPSNFGTPWGKYIELYNQLNLSMPTENWIPLEPNEYLGNFACSNNLLSDNMIHPTEAGYQQWVNQILIKKLFP